MTDALNQTPLYDWHVAQGAKLVPFAGFAMPVQYPGGIIQEHKHTREAAGLFDVSHMGQLKLHGEAAAQALEKLVPADLIGLGVGKQRYGLFTDANGGILDDLMITRAKSHLFLVVNAACKAQDIAHLQAGLGDACEIEVLHDRALLALQGPKAGEIMARLAPETAGLVFMSAAEVTIDGMACFLTRSGYTGEDGFEISVAAAHAESLARTLAAQPGVAPCGLGARDSLRLEAGLCLYGHDIDRTTTPVEAGLVWAMQKVRRTGGAREGGFPGSAIIFRQLAEGPSQKRVGLRPQGRAPVREGSELSDAEGRRVGRVTSGGFGPTLGAPLAMGYVDSVHSRIGTSLNATVRGKALAVEVVGLPFVEQRYYRG